MNAKKFAILTLAGLIGLAPALTPPVSAQRRGGGAQQAGQGARGGGQHGQGQGQAGQGQRRGGSGQGDQLRQRIHMDDSQRAQQQDRLRDCYGAAGEVRREARGMARADRFAAGEASQQRDRLREHVATLERQHEQLFQGFTQPQRDQLQDRVRTLDQSRDRLRERLQALDGELAGPSPDSRRFARRAKEVEQAAHEWQKQYRQLGDTLGLPPAP